MTIRDYILDLTADLARTGKAEVSKEMREPSVRALERFAVDPMAQLIQEEATASLNELDVEVSAVSVEAENAFLARDWDAVSDSEIASLLLNPGAVQVLAERLSEMWRPEWDEVHAAVGRMVKDLADELSEKDETLRTTFESEPTESNAFPVEPAKPNPTVHVAAKSGVSFGLAASTEEVQNYTSPDGKVEFRLDHYGEETIVNVLAAVVGEPHWPRLVVVDIVGSEILADLGEVTKSGSIIVPAAKLSAVIRGEGALDLRY